MYYRLYRIAKENIKEIAEQMVEGIYSTASDETTWYTSDFKGFKTKQEAIDHQIDWLLEEDTCE